MGSALYSKCNITLCVPLPNSSPFKADGHEVVSPAVEEVYLAPEYICHFFLDSLSTDSSDFKSAGCQVGKFGQFDI